MLISKLSVRKTVIRRLKSAGITIGGSKPYDIHITDERFFRRVFWGGSMALGESYMDGWWSCPRLEQCCFKLICGGMERYSQKPWELLWDYAVAAIQNRQSIQQVPNSITAHYDMGNDVFTEMLGPTMAYTCGVGKKDQTLEEAQDAKHKLICDKLQLSSGMTVLDIGCGWGPLMSYIDQYYSDVSVTGITRSKDQYEYVKKQIQYSQHKVAYADYREFGQPFQQFDRITSVEMFEHVGQKNHRAYMEAVYRLIDERKGLHLMQVITTRKSYRAGRTDPWLDRYIFPQSQLPSTAQILKVSEGLFSLEHVQNIGVHYYQTLMAWKRDYCDAISAGRLMHNEPTQRMMEYYLSLCAALFKSGRTHVSQLLFSTGLPRRNIFC